MKIFMQVIVFWCNNNMIWGLVFAVNKFSMHQSFVFLLCVVGIAVIPVLKYMQ